MMKKTIAKIGIPIVLAGAGGVAYQQLATVDVPFVEFKDMPINQETGGYYIEDVLDRIDEWIVTEKGKTENKIVYDKYMATREQDTYTIEERQIMIDAFNAKLDEIRDDCKNESRCVIQKVKKYGIRE